MKENDNSEIERLKKKNKKLKKELLNKQSVDI